MCTKWEQSKAVLYLLDWKIIVPAYIYPQKEKRVPLGKQSQEKGRRCEGKILNRKIQETTIQSMLQS